MGFGFRNLGIITVLNAERLPDLIAVGCEVLFLQLHAIVFGRVGTLVYFLTVVEVSLHSVLARFLSFLSNHVVQTVVARGLSKGAGVQRDQT